MSAKRPTDGWHQSPPFQTHLGVETVEAAGGRSLLRYVHRPELGNRKGDVHGGVLATLVDLAISQAIRSLRTDLAGVATINMTINYLEPATGTVIARGTASKVGGSIGIGEATCESEDGRILVQGSGAFRLIGHRKT